MQEKEETAVGKKKRAKTKWRRRLVLGMLLVAFWFAGDFIYSQYVALRISDWESSIAWTENGFVPGAEEYEAGEGDTALLMVHGFADSPQVYRKLAPALAAKGFYCKAILLPGFGQDIETYAASTTSSWIAKVDEELQALRSKHQRVWIVAHSLGGALSIHQILDQPKSADGLVLLAPAIEVSNQRSPIFPTRFWHELARYALPSTKITCSPYSVDARDPKERDRPGRNVFSPKTVVDNTFELIDANRGRAAEIQLPSLVMIATADQVVDSAATQDFYESLSSSRKKLVSLENSGHTVPVDLEWENVVAHIEAFIQQEALEPRP